MHEFELGIFRSFFIHLLRICHTLGMGTVQEVNARYILFIEWLCLPKAITAFGWFLLLDVVLFDDSAQTFLQ